MTATDTERPVNLLQSGRSAKPNSHEIELYEAVVGAARYGVRNGGLDAALAKHVQQRASQERKLSPRD